MHSVNVVEHQDRICRVRYVGKVHAEEKACTAGRFLTAIAHQTSEGHIHRETLGDEGKDLAKMGIISLGAVHGQKSGHPQYFKAAQRDFWGMQSSVSECCKGTEEC